MIGTKEICMLLLAGGLGSASTVVVQQKTTTAPKTVTKSKASTTPKRAVKRVPRKVSAPEPSTRILDCPTPSLGPSNLGSLGFDSNTEPFFDTSKRVPGIDYPFHPPYVFDPIEPVIPVTPTPGAVPEPLEWAMMVTGFGVVGLSLRSQHSKRKGVVSDG